MAAKIKLLEVCIDNLESAIKAVSGGAKRLEVCSSLSEGGLTPSSGLVLTIKEQIANLQIYVMIRCRSGSDFCYNNYDMDVMLADIKLFKKLDVNGFVFGALNSDGKINEPNCKKITSAAFPLPVTFHRAFDVCTEPPEAALETVISLGFERILTSGKQQYSHTDEACELIKNLILKSKDRIIIMPGSGVNENNIQKILDTGAFEVHASCLVKENKMTKDYMISMGKNVRDNSYILDQNKVEKIVSVLNKSKTI